MVFFLTGVYSLMIANVSSEMKAWYVCQLRRTSDPDSIIMTSEFGTINIQFPVDAPKILRDGTPIDNERGWLIMKEDGPAINLTCSSALSKLSDPLNVITD